MNKLLIEYINKQIKSIIPNQLTNNNYYYKQYNIIRLKRFLIHFAVIFSFQFLTVVHLKLQHVLLPMHPPLGISFTMGYLFGINAIPGLICGELLGLMSQALPLKFILLYSCSDILAGLMGSYKCQKTFFIDSNVIAVNKSNFLQFVSKNSFFTCIISSVIKLLAIRTIYTHGIEIKIWSVYVINLWLADLNAVLIIPSCICSWLYVVLNSHKISTKTINKLLIMTLISFIILSAVLLIYKSNQLIYLIIAAMLFSTYISYTYGYLVANLCLFILSTTYITYFIIFEYQYLLQYGIQVSLLISTSLLLYSITNLYISLIFKH